MRRGYHVKSRLPRPYQDRPFSATDFSLCVCCLKDHRLKSVPLKPSCKWWTVELFCDRLRRLRIEIFPPLRTGSPGCSVCRRATFVDVILKSIVSAATLISASSSGLASVSARRIESPPALTPSHAFAKPTKRSTKKGVANKVRRAPAPQRILVVDDVADVTEMIALFLKHAGFDVMTANSAQRALGMSSENHFDLIISDIGMPEMNGYDLAESLRKREAYETIPMIAVTGYT